MFLLTFLDRRCFILKLYSQDLTRQWQCLISSFHFQVFLLERSNSKLCFLGSCSSSHGASFRIQSTNEGFLLQVYAFLIQAMVDNSCLILLLRLKWHHRVILDPWQILELLMIKLKEPRLLNLNSFFLEGQCCHLSQQFDYVQVAQDSYFQISFQVILFLALATVLPE